MPSPAFQKLRARLAELFQLDAAAELDFGIYRILNARRTEIAAFLDSLESQVEAILGQAGADAGAPIRAELEKVEANLRTGGFDDDMIATAPKVKELRERLAALGTAGPDTAALRDDIFSLLTTFFSRYYKDGDFLSLRRYKADTYAIPYEGEEVKLHWANADQFYIKSAENFRDYTFRLGSPPARDKPDIRPRVTFKLVEADTDKDNNKPAAGKERRFIYTGEAIADGSHLTLHFQHRALTPEEGGGGDDGEAEADQPKKKGKKLNQTALNDRAIAAILHQHAKGPFLPLATLLPTKANPTRSLLEKRLTHYTTSNTFDYFIHKDLGGFLRRELDFFVKNEVVHLDDLDDAPEPAWSALRSRLKALRAIAHKVIRFLAQIEDFQKKLWLKKKFVIACDYVVTLDRIPEELYPAIAANDTQREEWVRLLAIDEIKGDLGRTGYSVPLTVEFLKENRFLPVDTRSFASRTREQLVSVSVPSLDGFAFEADNFHALRIIHSLMVEAVQAVYIDPPYNTDASPINYKNDYRNASWITLMASRIAATVPLMASDGVLCATIDDFQQKELSFLLESAFGRDSIAGTVIVRANPSGRPTPTGFGLAHEYAIFATKEPDRAISKLPRSDSQFRRYNKQDDAGRFQWELFRKRGSESLREDRRTAYYPFYVKGSTVRIPVMEWEEATRSWIVHEKPKPDEEVALPIDESGVERRWRWSRDAAAKDLDQFKAERSEDGRITIYYKYRPSLDGVTPTTVWSDAKYSATEHGTGTLKALFTGGGNFAYPKSIYAVEDCLRVSGLGKTGGIALDYFGGSGTTAHAVINLNREDGGNRRYILVEMGEHFDTVLVPRLKKVIYSKDWKDGKPASRDTGVSHCFKVLRLESYEDTLNNLRLHRTAEQQTALDELDLTSREAAEDYRLGYMLDLESAGSASLLNVSAFTDPWNYTLEVATGTAGETRPVNVDLVETFNWLLGLTVTSQSRTGGVLWVEGTNPQGERVLVLWRKTTGPDSVDAPALNDWCRKLKVSVLDGEYALIYVNGDHHLDNLRLEDQTWKVRLIDEEFPRLMFGE